MRIFKSKRFARFSRKERISDDALRKAVESVDKGSVDADYGGGVIKQRIARQNEGKSGGYRSIILFRKGHRAFFVYGFAKSQQDNIEADDEKDFKELATVLLAAPDEALAELLFLGEYIELT